MENNTEEKKQKQMRYSELLENEYKRAFETLEKNGYVFEKSLNFQLPNLSDHLPVISRQIGIEIRQTKLIQEVIKFFENTHGKHLCLLVSLFRCIQLYLCATFCQVFLQKKSDFL